MVTFNLITILATDYIYSKEKRPGQASSLLNVICRQIWYQSKSDTWIGNKCELPQVYPQYSLKGERHDPRARNQTHVHLVKIAMVYIANQETSSWKKKTKYPSKQQHCKYCGPLHYVTLKSGRGEVAWLLEFNTPNPWLTLLLVLGRVKLAKFALTKLINT